jgi:hypothetical protein
MELEKSRRKEEEGGGGREGRREAKSSRVCNAVDKVSDVRWQRADTSTPHDSKQK